MPIRKFGDYCAKWEYGLDSDSSGDSALSESESAFRVDFFKNEQFLYSLKRNSYRTESDEFLLLEYFEIEGDSDNSREDKRLRVVHLFNLEHGVISVIDADTGKQMHQTYPEDYFILDYKMFDDREYMYVSGWIWSPFPCRFIIHIPTLLKTPDYPLIWISTADQTQKFGGEIDLYGCATVEEFLKRKDDIFRQKRIQKETGIFNDNREKQTLLHLLLENRFQSEVRFETVRAEENLRSLLENDAATFGVKCWGNVSGQDFTHRYARVLMEEIQFDGAAKCTDDRRPPPGVSDNLSLLIPKLLSGGFVKALPLEQFNLRFEIDATMCDGVKIAVTVNIVQDLTWDGQEPTVWDKAMNVRRCEVDPKKPVSVTVSIRN